MAAAGVEGRKGGRLMALRQQSGICKHDGTSQWSDSIASETVQVGEGRGEERKWVVGWGSKMLASYGVAAAEWRRARRKTKAQNHVWAKHPRPIRLVAPPLSPQLCVLLSVCLSSSPSLPSTFLTRDHSRLSGWLQIPQIVRLASPVSLSEWLAWADAACDHG
ncbi:hypothetical protein BO70DRAFT_70580 [Aspergillus heteromorphus CBS 117.55]|uniref:Uncharacterized protein n=1 Tax=Aspergillus heteromorphus CBS 117.55 TaxID=1448321 RepID=A0A317VSY1_9EURO|nr:uncharacterized protein BO70DRAFT_70580 [Aspergillus heteromorphus CBS 117.55]PWY77025.1 hypothetical protein BO70DRAFT_70580 [Aspergillus heteromorphus CBS 117.55]